VPETGDEALECALHCLVEECLVIIEASDPFSSNPILTPVSQASLASTFQTLTSMISY